MTTGTRKVLSDSTLAIVGFVAVAALFTFVVNTAFEKGRDRGIRDSAAALWMACLSKHENIPEPREICLEIFEHDVGLAVGGVE
jgi:hypothetical protein